MLIPLTADLNDDYAGIYSYAMNICRHIIFTSSLDTHGQRLDLYDSHKIPYMFSI